MSGEATAELRVIRVVGAAIFDEEGRCLVTRRSASMSNPGKWEFPGGKIESGETPEQALAREIEEELSLEIEVGAWVGVGMVRADARTQIRLDVYRAKVVSGELELSEHDASKWLVPQEFDAVEWAAADVPIVEVLQR